MSSTVKAFFTLLLLGIACWSYYVFALSAPVSQQRVAGPPPTALLLAPIPDSAPNAGQLRRGQYLVLAGDCVACHTRKGGKPFGGGYVLNVPYGKIYSANITSDRQTGLGEWTPDQFYRALHEGRGRNGEHLYPAFPYPYFTHIAREDADAMLAFLKTVPAENYTPPSNELPIPLNLRVSLAGWNMLYFRPENFQPDAAKSAEWNRGAYLVTAVAHCGACHTPKNALGADRADRAFQGGVLERWVAPNLTSSERMGVGHWSKNDIAEYLKTGRNSHANAGATMSDVVSDSTSIMTDEDRTAIATYIKDIAAAGNEPNNTAPDAGVMARGSAIYSDTCAACHMDEGKGQERFFPPLRGNAVVQQNDPTTLIHLVLAGTRTAVTSTRPTGLAMPSFAWRLDDWQTADLLTYIRNSWGNHASAVSASKVQDMRKKLQLETVRLPEEHAQAAPAP